MDFLFPELFSNISFFIVAVNLYILEYKNSTVLHNKTQIIQTEVIENET